MGDTQKVTVFLFQILYASCVSVGLFSRELGKQPRTPQPLQRTGGGSGWGQSEAGAGKGKLPDCGSKGSVNGPGDKPQGRC